MSDHKYRFIHYVTFKKGGYLFLSNLVDVGRRLIKGGVRIVSWTVLDYHLVVVSVLFYSYSAEG